MTMQRIAAERLSRCLVGHVGLYRGDELRWILLKQENDYQAAMEARR